MGVSAMPYVIVVYDVAPERGQRVLDYLRRYLTWVQNSALEGFLTEAQLAQVWQDLEGLIDVERDSVYLYELPSDRFLRRRVLGRMKGMQDNIL
jgi:CRISPR-associated protein Cas2